MTKQVINQKLQGRAITSSLNICFLRILGLILLVELGSEQVSQNLALKLIRKANCPPQCGWVSPNPVKTRAE